MPSILSQVDAPGLDPRLNKASQGGRGRAAGHQQNTPVAVTLCGSVTPDRHRHTPRVHRAFHSSPAYTHITTEARLSAAFCLSVALKCLQSVVLDSC